VSFDYLANLRKLKKNFFCGMGGHNEERGYSSMKSLIKGYRREKRLGTAVLDNELTDGNEVVSLTHQSSFTPTKISGTHSC
jgi:hypothetical protein